MGLAGSFGDQAYICRACGHTTALYSPNCPVCLNKTLAPVQQHQAPGPSATNTGAPRYETETAPKRGMSFELIAIVLALIVVAYSVFFVRKPDASKTDNQPQAVDSETKPEPRRTQPVRHVRRPAQASKPRNTSPGGSAPRRAAPMKLWSADEDSE